MRWSRAAAEAHAGVLAGRLAALQAAGAGDDQPPPT
jgi:hypothetical protein